MKPDQFGLKVTALEALAYFVPGTVLLWSLVYLDARNWQFLPPAWPVTSLDTAMAGSLIVILGVVVQQIGHVFTPPYDNCYKAWRRGLELQRLRKGEGRSPWQQYRKTAARQDAASHVYHAMKAALSAAGQPVDRILMLEGLSKMFRALCVTVIGVAVILVFDRAFVAAGVLAVTAGVAFIIFCQLRYLSTEELYRASVLMLDQQAAKAAAPRRRPA